MRSGINLPVDIAGNSLGGTIALKAARRGIARSESSSLHLGCGQKTARPTSHTCSELFDLSRQGSQAF